VEAIMNLKYVAIFEVIFNISYLVIIWTYVTKMMSFQLKDTISRYLMWAFFLLAVGDSLHVGLRVVAHALGDIDYIWSIGNNAILLTGVGAMATAFTVTITYLLLTKAWHHTYGKNKQVLYGVYILSLIRLILLVLPQNHWFSKASYLWGLFRNLPLTLVGLILIVVFYNQEEFYFKKFSWYIALSYAFYLPVILFVRFVPELGMLMIPKTVMYLFMIQLVYKTHFKRALK